MIYVTNTMPNDIKTMYEVKESMLDRNAPLQLVTPMMTVPVLSEKIENRRKRIKADVQLCDGQIAILKAVAELDKNGTVYVAFDSYLDMFVLHGIEQLEIEKRVEEGKYTYMPFKMWNTLTNDEGSGVAELLTMGKDVADAVLTICKAYESRYNIDLPHEEFIK